MKKFQKSVTTLVSLTCMMVFIVVSACTNSKEEKYYSDEPLPRAYVAHRTMSKVDIDGKAIEKDWSLAEWSDEFIDIEGVKKPKFNTRFKMLWDDEFMYYYVEMEEPHVWGNLRQRDTVIFLNNDFEIFWDPNGDGHEYYEFEINALNTTWDLFLNKPYREKNAAMDSWNIDGLKSAIVVNGTLNNPTDIDAGWTLEIAVPWKAFKRAFRDDNVPVNDFWRINFSRVNWDHDITWNKNKTCGNYDRKKDSDGNYLPEYNWVWSPQWEINMHKPESWGYVYFTDKPATEKVNFAIPEEDKVSRFLFHLYREMKAQLNSQDASNDSKKNKPKISDLNGSVLEYGGVEYVPTLEYYCGGWNIFLEVDGKTRLINNEGLYKEF